MKLGFIGVGNLGVHLAGSLVRAGFPVTVHDLHREAAADLLDTGAAWADSPQRVAEAVDSVFTCLPSPAAVTTVVAGENGILAGLKTGGTWIDMSTNDLHELKRLAGLAAEKGIACLEAPVTGGVHKAAAGEITVLVSGEAAVFEAHRTALQAMGGRVFYMGGLGSASVIKVITNMLAFIHLVAAGEALMLAKRGGLDLAQTFEVIKASSGNSFVHETESQVILNGSYNIGFTMDLACKDLYLAHQLGREFGVPLELAGLVEQTFMRARAQYGGQAWSSQVVKLLEDALGTDLRAPGFPEVLK
jgi:3-hydroxyisobutyrate dehydrogenase